MNVIQTWKQAGFVLSPTPMVIMSLAASLILFLQVAGSQSSRVYEAGVACNVTDMEASQERVTARLNCETTSGVVTTRTHHGPTVMYLLQTRSTHITCDVHVAGNVSNCVVVPESTSTP
jgi:hypothetical protein